MCGKRLNDMLAAAAYFLLFPSFVFADHPDVEPKISVGEISGKTMGTRYVVKLQDRNTSGSPIDLVALKAKVQQRLDDINASMSTYREDSEISRFNRQTGSNAFPVSRDFQQVVERSIEIHGLTNGKFDITVGPLVRFWGFAGGTPPQTMPTPGAIQPVLDRIGTTNLKCTDHGLQKSHPDLELDVSAIAKGFAVDEIAAVVSMKTPNFMVEIGGEVFASGFNPVTSGPWAIGIELPSELPVDFSPTVAARVELSGRALATSGDYRNVVIIEGKKLQHTIDPTTGYPVNNGIRSVSVIADDCMTADGLATGLMAHGLDEIQAFSESHHASVLVLFEKAPGKIGFWSSPTFEAQMLIPVSESTEENPAVDQGTHPIYLVLGTILVFGLAISGMAIGVIMSNRQLKGSCGGLSSMSGNENSDSSPCGLCTKPTSECSKRENAETPVE